MDRGNKRIREVPVSQDIFEQTAAQAMSNPPKFPLLEGQEKFWIVRQITLLTKLRKIQWKQDVRHSHIVAYASYLGLIIYIDRKNGCERNDPSGILFNVYDEYQKHQKYLATVSFDGVNQVVIDEFITAAWASLKKEHVHEERPLNLVWDILNLR